LIERSAERRSATTPTASRQVAACARQSRWSKCSSTFRPRSTRLERVACAIGYYGAQTIPFAHETPRVPVLFHFGTMDPRISEADRDTIRHHNPQIETHVFPADHGFNCNHRKEWHAPSAEKALGLTLDFMRRNMPGGPNASA
jgi:dienelactone hydrolase